jgi:putative ATP-dependent endonuclease of OLD family
VEKLNTELKSNRVMRGRDVSIELREEEIDEWKRQMAITVDKIPFEQMGFGTQNTIKVELAIENGAEQVNMILIEEPENCLSHTNMAKLVHRIYSTEGKQIFISTHSSFIANKLNLGNILLVDDGIVKNFHHIPPETIAYFIKLPGYDTLRLVLAEKVILVEGPTDDLIIQRAYKDKRGCLPIDNGIDIIAVDSLAFKRYCDIAVILKKQIAVVTDNDGNIKTNIELKYSNYWDYDFIHFFYEENEKLNTIEPSVLAVNCDENEQPTTKFREIISKNGSLNERDYAGILKFMSKNKSEWAMRVFDSDNSINYPKYIEELIDEYC